MTTTTVSADARRLAAQLTELQTKLANLAGNTSYRLDNDDTHPHHLLECLLDRLTELATQPVLPPSTVDGPSCCGRPMTRETRPPLVWYLPGEPGRPPHVSIIYRCPVCTTKRAVQVTDRAERHRLLMEATQ